jgi:hypothetical protein
MPKHQLELIEPKPLGRLMGTLEILLSRNADQYNTFHCALDTRTVEIFSDALQSYWKRLHEIDSTARDMENAK